jgi:hypothetical protein
MHVHTIAPYSKFFVTSSTNPKRGIELVHPLEACMLDQALITDHPAEQYLTCRRHKKPSLENPSCCPRLRQSGLETCLQVQTTASDFCQRGSSIAHHSCHTSCSLGTSGHSSLRPSVPALHHRLCMMRRFAHYSNRWASGTTSALSCTSNGSEAYALASTLHHLRRCSQAAAVDAVRGRLTLYHRLLRHASL